MSDTTNTVSLFDLESSQAYRSLSLEDQQVTTSNYITEYGNKDAISALSDMRSSRSFQDLSEEDQVQTVANYRSWYGIQPPDSDSALTQGFTSLKSATSYATDMGMRDFEAAAQSIFDITAYTEANPSSEASQGLSKAWEGGDGVGGAIGDVVDEVLNDFQEAPGIWQGIASLYENAKAMGTGIVKQTPNMIPPITGLIAGGALGSTASPVGTVVGGFAGASAGNAMVEGQGIAIGELQKAGINPKDKAAVSTFLENNYTELFGKTAGKGAIIGAVDTVTMGISHFLLSGPGKLATKKALTEMGVNLTDKAAIKAATKSTEFGQKILTDTTFQATQKGINKAARNTAAAVTEPGGEFTGEYVGSGVALNEWDTKDAAIEAISSVGQSGITFAGQKAYQAIKTPQKTIEEIIADTDNINLDDPEAAAKDLGNIEPSVANAPEMTSIDTSIQGELEKAYAGVQDAITAAEWERQQEESLKYLRDKNKANTRLSQRDDTREERAFMQEYNPDLPGSKERRKAISEGRIPVEELTPDELIEYKAEQEKQVELDKATEMYKKKLAENKGHERLVEWGQEEAQWNKQAHSALKNNQKNNGVFLEGEQAFIQEYELGNNSANMYPGGPPVSEKQAEWDRTEDASQKAKKKEEGTNEENVQQNNGIDSGSADVSQGSRGNEEAGAGNGKAGTVERIDNAHSVEAKITKLKKQLKNPKISPRMRAKKERLLTELGVSTNSRVGDDRRETKGAEGDTSKGRRSIKSEKIDNLDSVAHGQAVNTSPSEAQKEAGNYKKSHVNLDGLDITIENPTGSIRSGTDQKGRKWEQELANDYGYIKQTEGFDGDHVDVFFTKGYQGGADKVHIVNQYNNDGTFDEVKVVIGAKGSVVAKRTYNANYEKGWKGGKDVVEMSMDDFKVWVKSDAPKQGPAASDKVYNKSGKVVNEEVEGLQSKPDQNTQQTEAPTSTEAIASKGISVTKHASNGATSNESKPNQEKKPQEESFTVQEAETSIADANGEVENLYESDTVTIDKAKEEGREFLTVFDIKDGSNKKTKRKHQPTSVLQENSSGEGLAPSITPAIKSNISPKQQGVKEEPTVSTDHTEGRKNGGSDVKYSISDNDRENVPVKIPVIGEDASREARKLEKSLERATRRRGYRKGEGKVTIVRVQPEFAKTLKRIAEIFGKKVVFVKDDGSGRLNFNGLVIRDKHPDIIFINVDNDYHPTTVLGHELLHHLKTDRPSLYKILHKYLADYVGDAWYSYEAQYKIDIVKAGFGERTSVEIQEEYLADYMGDLFSDETFWKELAGQKPVLFKRITNAIIEYLDKIILKFKKARIDRSSDKFFTDMVKAREAVKAAVINYAQGTQKDLAKGDSTDIQSGYEGIKRSHKNKNRSKKQGSQASGYAKEYTAGLQSTGVSGVVSPSQHGEARQEPREVTAATIDTPAFKQWFGDSTLEDESGNPLEFFHGSPTFGTEDGTDAWTFKGIDSKLRKSKSPQSGLGDFYTIAPTEAQGYSRGTGNVHKFAIRLENPKVLNSYDLPDFDTPDEARAYSKRLRDLEGHDGIYLQDEDHAIIFEGNQAKSLEINSGGFSREDNDVRYSIRKETRTGIHAVLPPNPFTGSKDAIDRAIENAAPKWGDRWERFVYTMADTLDPRKRVMNLAGDQTARTDILTVERLRGKKTADETDQFMKKSVEPLLKQLAKGKVKIREFEEYKYAMHVPERNEQMRRVNAMRYIDRFLQQMTKKEAGVWKDAMAEIRNQAKLEEWDLFKKHDAYLDLMQEIYLDLDRREHDLTDKQRELDERVWTDKEILKGTDEFLYRMLKISKERVAYSREINAEWDTASPRFAGITDEEAGAILQKFEGDSRIATIKSASKKLDQINGQKLKILYDSGELSSEEYFFTKTLYKHYVPLYRDGFDDNRPATGRPTGPTGKPLQVAKGSMREVVDIMAHTVQNYQTAINRSNKAEAGRTLFNFVQANPDAGITIEAGEKKPTHDKEGNIVTYTDTTEPDNGVFVKVDGKRYTLVFDNDSRTARGKTLGRFLESIKDADVGLGSTMRFLTALNRHLAMVNTMLSPEFILSNFARDAQTAGIHLEETKAKGLQKKVVKDLFPAIRGIFQAEYGKESSKMAKWYRDFAKNGGKIGWLQGYDNIKDLARELQSTMELHQEGHTTKKALKALKDIVSHSNTAVENGVRLSVYKNLVEAGESKAKAALAASNLTVDFTRRGKLGPKLNALYLFSNAGIQGNVRMVKAVVRNGKVRTLVGGITATGFAMHLLALSMGGDDDTGESYLNGVEDFVKERNMIIMRPGTKGKFFKIPMPYGYNGFFNLGSEIASMVASMMNGKDYNAAESAMRVVNIFANSFSPIQGGTVLQTLAPTALDPVVKVQENASWNGGGLMPKQPMYGPPNPEHTRYWSTVSETSKYITATLNKLTGGDEYKGGVIDISPEVLDMIYETITGSLGRFVANTFALPRRIMAEKEVPTSKIPFVRGVAGEQSEYVVGKRYREQVEDIEIFKQRFDNAGTLDKKRALAKDPLYMKMKTIKPFERAIKKLRKKKNKYKDAGNDKAVEQLDGMIRGYQIEFLKAAA